MNTLEIQEIAKNLTLTLDNPLSVKLQIRQITLAQKQLRAIKKEINGMIRKLDDTASQSSPPNVVSVEFDLFGKYKWAQRVKAERKRWTESEKTKARQPYLEIKEYIDDLILEGDRLKLMADEYLFAK